MYEDEGIKELLNLSKQIISSRLTLGSSIFVQAKVLPKTIWRFKKEKKMEKEHFVCLV